MSSTTAFARPAAAAWVVFVVLVHLGIAAIFVGQGGAAWSTLPLDDGYIYLVYARSLAEHLSLTYNPGDWQTGTTGVLFPLLLAPLLRLGAPAVAAAKALSLAGGIACAFGSGRLVAGLAEDAGFPRGGRLVSATRAGQLAALVLALHPHFAFARVSGMELTVAAALGLWGLVALRAGRLGVAGLLLGLAACTRPEAALLVAAAGAALLVPDPSLDLATRVRRAARLGAVAAVPLGAWMATCLAISGYPLPASFYVKVSSLSWDAPGAVGRVLGFFLEGPWFLTLTIGTATAAGAALVLRGPAWRPAGLALAAFPVGGLLFLGRSGNIGSDAPLDVAGSLRCFYFARYMLLLLPFLSSILVLGVLVLSAAAAARVRRVGAGAALGVLGLVLTGAWLAGYPRYLATYARNCEEIRSLQVAAAEWIRANTAPGDLVATNDAGAIRFLGERTVLDLIGLNDSELAHEALQDNERFLTYLYQRRPRWFAVFPEWFPDLFRASGIRFRKVFETSVARNSIAGSHHLVVLEASYPTGGPPPLPAP